MPSWSQAFRIVVLSPHSFDTLQRSYSGCRAAWKEKSFRSEAIALRPFRDRVRLGGHHRVKSLRRASTWAHASRANSSTRVGASSSIPLWRVRSLPMFCMKTVLINPVDVVMWVSVVIVPHIEILLKEPGLYRGRCKAARLDLQPFSQSQRGRKQGNGERDRPFLQQLMISFWDIGAIEDKEW